mmetsp:Transcript_14359/g.41257  ORF Transcript_14359/g.41257 Transcript_14359/m.41257 type:complete len:258 (-) Transcript_14359:935-1708(-)
MKRVMETRLDTSESKMLAIRGRMLNFSFMQKSTGCNSLPCSILDRATAMRMPIIMLSTMFQFSWPKCTAKPFFGPKSRWRRRTRRLLWSTFIADCPRRDIAETIGSSGGVHVRSPRSAVGTDLCMLCLTTRSSQLDESLDISLHVGLRLPVPPCLWMLWSVCDVVNGGWVCCPDSAAAHQLKTRSNSAHTWSTCAEPRAAAPCCLRGGNGVHHRSSSSPVSDSGTGEAAALRIGDALRPLSCKQAWRRTTRSRSSSI